jgi:hypothetical protein
MNSLEVLVSVSFGHLWVPHFLRDFMREKACPRAQSKASLLLPIPPQPHRGERM